ncbi:oligosaccharide flippase family protein [Variovorax ginsengisoli]|uniref:PST family polysaccharide transporter n=1 Tax=Variovorax ginsengisoli TaxID=363844 RepID=A0ABT9SEA0_9BURK|nr:oligosaccharide flippase family protein [Variovorax ginsengisoli]MDP9902209.1 PST family polysaccharide transporter [Variovorax ginsengisoli]
MASVKKNISFLLFLHCTNYVFPLLLLPYLVRTLGAKEYGIYSMAVAFIQYFNVLTDYGYNLSATREISLVRQDRKTVSQIYWTTIFSKLIIFSIGIVVLFPFLFFINLKSQEIIVIGICITGVLGNIFYPIWYFQGTEKMLPMSVITGISRFLVLLLTFVVVSTAADTNNAVFVFGLAYIIPAVYLNLNLILKKEVVFYIPSPLEVWASIKGSSSLFLANFAITFYTSINVFVVGHWTGAVAAGNYYAADRLKFALQNFMSPISQAIYPRFCAVDDAGKLILLKRYGTVFFAFAFFIGLAMWLLGEYVVSRYLGVNAGSAPFYFKLMAPYIPVIAVGIIFGHWWLAARGNGSKLSILYVGGAILHMTYLFPLLNRFGVTGVIFATFATQCLIVVGMIYAFWKSFEKK